MSVGMPATLWLDAFGALIHRAFGEHAYHVGSSVQSKVWRDVDVRVMLDDATYARLELGDPQRSHENARWVALCLAFSALGKEMTGLPIDFQIQTISEANEKFLSSAGCVRSCLGIRTPIEMPMLPKAAVEDRALDQIMAEVEARKAGEQL